MQTAEKVAEQKRISEGPAVLVLAASERAPAYEAQMRILEEQADEFHARGVVVMCVFQEGECSIGSERMDEALASSLRERYLAPDEDFQIVVLGPGGRVVRSDDAPLQGAAILRSLGEA